MIYVKLEQSDIFNQSVRTKPRGPTGICNGPDLKQGWLLSDYYYFLKDRNSRVLVTHPLARRFSDMEL